MTKCSCGHEHSDNNFDENEEKNAHIMIRADRVKEIQLEPGGLVKILMEDDNGNTVETLEIDFESAEQAEKWINDKFGKYL